MLLSMLHFAGFAPTCWCLAWGRIPDDGSMDPSTCPTRSPISQTMAWHTLTQCGFVVFGSVAHGCMGAYGIISLEQLPVWIFKPLWHHWQHLGFCFSLSFFFFLFCHSSFSLSFFLRMAMSDSWRFSLFYFQSVLPIATLSPPEWPALRWAAMRSILMFH